MTGRTILGEWQQADMLLLTTTNRAPRVAQAYARR